MKKIIIIVLSLAIVFGFLFWRFGPKISLFGGKKVEQGPIELTYWGLWEEDNLIRPVIDLYQSKYPNIKINYVRQSSLNYRTRVQSQITDGVGPDVFRIHNSWLPMMEDNLIPAPSDIFTINDYKNLFYPVAFDSFVKNNNIYASPMEIDGLVLFYNEELLQNIGGKPPRTWKEFIETAKNIVVADQRGIKTAGAGIGAVSNVDHFSDILGLLLLQQPNVNLEKVDSDAAAEVLRFYTGFITDPKKKVWDVNLPNSTQMFAEGRLGFYFAPSWRAHEIKASNPSLKFKIAPVPQLSSKVVNWASFWGEAVSKGSKNPNEAWKFVKFLTSEDAERLMYQEEAKIRVFGEPYSLVSLQADLAQDPFVGAVVMQGPNYKFWYLASNTFDNGVNDQMIKYWEDGVNATLAGIDPQIALQTIAKGVTQVLNDFVNKEPAASATPR